MTTDGGNNWRVSHIQDYLPNEQRFSRIENLQIDDNGSGQVKLKVSPDTKVSFKTIFTNDYGVTWQDE